jgi:hypothetical protein
MFRPTSLQDNRIADQPALQRHVREGFPGRFHYVGPLASGEPIRSAVVEDQQIGLDEGAEEAREAAIAVRQLRVGKQSHSPEPATSTSNGKGYQSSRQPRSRRPPSFGRRCFRLSGSVARALCRPAGRIRVGFSTAPANHFGYHLT